MTTPNSTATAVAVKTAPEAPAATAVVPMTEKGIRIAEAKERNAMAIAIRGTQWGKELDSPKAVAAIAHYCQLNGLDPLRHIDILGGNIYPNATVYRERGAPLLIDGTIRMDEPQFIHRDERLDKLATFDTPEGKWALVEVGRRMQARIEHAAPEDATGAAVVRMHLKSGATVVGVNWCGGMSKEKKRKDGSKYRSDPIGDAEPTKTAVSRAERRAWLRVIDLSPQYAAQMGRIEASIKVVNRELKEIAVEETEADARVHPTPLLKHGENAYETGANPAETDTRSAEDEEFELRMAEDDGR